MNIVLIGATGLVGKATLSALLNEDSLTTLHVFVRKPTKISHPKLQEHIVDFEDISSIDFPKGVNTFISCLGTTLKKAGSKSAQYHIDVDYVEQCAALALKNGVEHVILLSSIGAKAGSSNFYLNMKGELEDKLRALGPLRYDILRPSVLDGKRDEFRFGERVGLVLMRLLKFLPGFHFYQAIHADLLAKIIVLRCSVSDIPGEYVLTGSELHAFARSMKK